MCVDSLWHESIYTKYPVKTYIMCVGYVKDYHL